jgi:hypothetical protein
MNMKTTVTTRKSNQAGSALMLTLIMSAIALALLAGAMSWSASNTRMTYRSIQYNQSIAAAEAATEKVVAQMNQDYLNGDEKLVVNNLNTYRQTIPLASDSPYWGAWQFDDANGNIGRTYVQSTSSSNYTVLDSTYAGLKGYVSTYTIASHAQDTASSQNVMAGVLQQLQLTSIPIFQMAMYSSGEMEISCGQPFTIDGRVHSNGELYIEPDATPLTFQSSVTAVTGVAYQRDPLDTRGTPAGHYVFTLTNQPVTPVNPLTLPIGTTNTPTAIREIIEPPPAGGDTNLSLSRIRYYNECDMVLVASDSGVSATSGHFNGFGTQIPTSDLATFVSTTNSFWDGREGKTVQPIDINIGKLAVWSQTNTILRGSVATSNLILNSIYVVDNRTLAGNLNAVRVFNGTNLPSHGLTVATGRPLYVWGDYNELTSANLGTPDTSMTLPASLVGDAITILSDNWSDGNGTSMGTAKSTTVNAAILTGAVETTAGQYSGGMENFPRFLEDWSSAVFTYNGSMIKMFPSLYATNVWNGINYTKNYYSPPTRRWAYDVNFDDPLKLPPWTPKLLVVNRGQWATVAPGQNAAP